MKRLAILFLFCPLFVQAAATRFIFDGDSITYGATQYPDNTQAIFQNYFPTLSWAQGKANFSCTNIAVSGQPLDPAVNGNGGGSMWERFDANVLPNIGGAGTNTWVWALIGMNDLQYYASAHPLDTYLGQTNWLGWERLLTNYWYRCRTNGAKVVGTTCFDKVPTVWHTTDWDDVMLMMNSNINRQIRIDAAAGACDAFADNQLLISILYTNYLTLSDPFPYDGTTHLNVFGEESMQTNLNAVMLQVEKTYYVDCKRTGSGLNDGTTWANAWTNMLYLHAASNNVPAGSIVCISGGDYLTTNEWTDDTAFFNLASGTSGSPITYRHESSPLETTPTVTINTTLSLNGYTILDGSTTTNCEGAIGGNTFAVPSVLTNTSIVLNSRGRDILYNKYHPAYSVLSGGLVTVKWVGIQGFLDINEANAAVMESNSGGARAKLVTSTSAPLLDMRYCWMREYRSLAALSGDGSAAFAQINISYSLFQSNYYGYFDEGYGPNIDFHHNVVKDRFPSPHHRSEADGFQTSGTINYSRVHHNIMEPTDNNLISVTFTDGITNFFWYDNLIQPQDDAHHPALDPTVGVGNCAIEPGVPAQWPALDPNTNTLLLPPLVISNMVFVNNTTIMKPLYNAMSQFMVLQPDRPSRFPRWCDIPDGGFVFLNNLDHGSIVSGAAETFSGAGAIYHPEIDITNQVDPVNLWGYTSNSMVFDYNLWSTTSAISSWVQWVSYTNGGGYRDTNSLPTNLYLTNAAIVASTIGYTHNATMAAGFANEAGRDYRPTYASMVMGTNLTSLTNLMPDIDKDLYGNQRPATGPWTAGAIEYQPTFGGPTNGLVLWLQFDRPEWWTNGGYIPDHSGLGNHARIYDPPAWTATTGGHTYPSLTNGPNGLPGAVFTTNYNDGSYWYGQYAAVTNLVNGLDYLTNATWAAWVWFPSGGNLPTFSIMDTAWGTSSNWFFGAQYAGVVGLGVYTNLAATPYFRAFEFPLTGDLPGWNHYAVTWDGSTWTGYLNGTNYAANTVTGIGPLSSTNSSNPDPAKSWIAIGCFSHGTAPQDPSAGPNNGWIESPMADLRIYNRALSGAEVLAIYGGTNAPVASLPSFGSGVSFGAGVTIKQ